MTRPLSHLAAGLFVVLAVTAPAVDASPVRADGPTLTCHQIPCTYSVSGGAVGLNFAGVGVRCRSIAGGGQLREAAGSAVFEVGDCREAVTGLGFRCSSPMLAPGHMRTGRLGAQLMRGSGNTPKIEFLGLRVSFRCANVLKFSIEGFLVGHLDRRQCNMEARKLALAPVLFAHGQIGSAPFYDVYTDADEKSYQLPGPWPMEFRRPVTLAC
jgi:hypothetical protein